MVIYDIGPMDDTGDDDIPDFDSRTAENTMPESNTAEKRQRPLMVTTSKAKPTASTTAGTAASSRTKPSTAGTAASTTAGTAGTAQEKTAAQPAQDPQAVFKRLKVEHEDLNDRIDNVQLALCDVKKASREFPDEGGDLEAQNAAMREGIAGMKAVFQKVADSLPPL